MSAATIHFRVNGQDASAALDGNTPLLHVLRNDLQLKGTRFGCGTGACGSCTVLTNSVAGGGLGCGSSVGFSRAKA